MDPTIQAEAERAALRLVLSVVAHMVASGTRDPLEQRARLTQMNDQCRLSAERTMSHLPGVERNEYVSRVISQLDAFYRGITIT